MGLGLACQEDGVTPAAQTALQNALQNAQVAVHLANRELQRVRDTAQRSARDGAAAVASPALMTPLVAATMEFAAAQRVAAAAFTQLRDIDTHGRKDEELLRDAVAALTEELVAARFGSSRPVRLTSSIQFSSTRRIRQWLSAEQRAGGEPIV